MVSVINAANLGIQSTNLYGSQNTKISASNVETEKVEGVEEQNAAAVSEDGDTLTLSTEGTALQKAQKTYTGQSQQSGLDSVLNYESEESPNAVANAAAELGISTEETELDQASAAASGATGASSSSSADSDLSSYTEQELREMLENGEITQAEYNEEIQSRRQGNASEEESEAADTTDATGAAES